MGKSSKGTIKLRRAHKVMLTLGAVLPLSAALAQVADTAAPPPPPAPSADQAGTPPPLSIVTVTAQRREANIKDVPVSETVMEKEKLDVLSSSGMNVLGLAAEAPGLYVESSNGRASPRFYIRGYGNTDYSTFASQPVSLIIDDIVQENPVLKGVPLFDVAGVEVLRGPQGTLFGRNTPAGVVEIDTAKPSLTKESGYFSVSDGTYNTANIEGAVNVPLSDQWAMRFSALGQHRDNWVTNTGGGTPNEAGYTETADRLQFLYRPDNTFKALFNLHSREATGSSTLFRANIIEPGTNNLVPGFNPSQAQSDGANSQYVHSAGGSANLSWNLENIKLHSITGYESISSYLSVGDIDGGTPTGPGFIPFQVETSAGIPDHRQFTQEFRAESKNDGPLNWQAGLYYFNENAAGTNTTFANDNAVPTPQDSILENRQKNTAYALYGSLNYDVSEQLKVSGGLRYTEDKKEFSTVFSQNQAPGSGPTGINENANNVSWDASGTYALSHDTNAYARVATGFRAPSIAPPAEGDPLSVAKAETILSYEAGMKMDLLDRRARLNFSVFSYEVKNQQLTAVGGASNVTTLVNAAKTVGRGAEFDLDANLTERLRLTAGGSYNYTQIRDPNLYVAGCASCIMLSPQLGTTGLYSINGNSLPEAPKWIFNLTARYGIPMGNNDELYFLTDWSYRSQIDFFLYRAVEFTGKALPQGGLRSGYKWHGGKYEVAAYVRNLTNKVEAVGGIDFDNLTGFINDPRIVGMQFRVNF